MEWDLHNKWAAKLGIDEQTSKGINSLVDNIGEEELAIEFKQRKGEYEAKVLDRKGEAKGNSALGLVVALHDDKHDAGRKITTDSKIYAEIQLEFLKDKGKDHVTAWYLHNYLDYIDEMWNSGKGIKVLLNEYQQKYPHICSQQIADFLIDHEEELAADMSDCGSID